ncbi:DUF523 domain-containing protein [Photobacterium sp. J15]|uniref:DUF523 domain-containing protein n=1 Tax=Photobacterium sp. J15 TaxID=265901 RepID=UPI0007E48F1D|nr:DUF523 domain-containing protein [Photobacterium sp. J15]
MEKILISACLYGKAVRYDGKDNFLAHPQLQQWKQQGRLVVVCPEVSGGLATPRPPAEIQADGTILTVDGNDVTTAFNCGAEEAAVLCRQHKIKLALLKENSPSCGSHAIYDGQFNGTKIPGEGKTTSALKLLGVKVFNESQIDELAKALTTSEY